MRGLYQAVRTVSSGLYRQCEYFLLTKHLSLTKRNVNGYIEPMTALKKDRNDKMLADHKAGKSVYAIAKEHKLTWPRAKRIIIEHEERQKKHPNPSREDGGHKEK